MMKAREKLTQAKNSESSDGVHGIVDTITPRMTAQTLVNALVSVLYPFHTDVHLCLPTSVDQMAAVTINMIGKRVPQRVF
jgi:hypothetical protein